MPPRSPELNAEVRSTQRHGDRERVEQKFPRIVACTLDHDGCVTCADAGIPVWVIAVDGDDALCEDVAGNQARIAMELVSPVSVGDRLLTHGGVAIGRIER